LPASLAYEWPDSSLNLFLLCLGWAGCASTTLPAALAAALATALHAHFTLCVFARVKAFSPETE